MPTGLFIAGSQISPLPLDFVTESSAILAKKGAGKTNAAIVLLEEVYAAGVPVVSIDPKGDHWGVRANGTGKGLPIPVFGGLHGDIPLEPTAGAYIADLVRSKRLSVILDVSEFSIAERARFLTAFADRLYRSPIKEPLFLILEEAHEYIPQMVRGEDAKMVGAFERLVKLGRHKGLGVLMVTQRSASLNKNVLTQVDNLFAMRTTSPQDRAVVKLWMGAVDGDATYIEDLAKLATGECILWQPERGSALQFRFRMRHTYDAGATPKVGEKVKPPSTLADVDLGEIQTAMAETIEKAKADDPKHLRAELARVTRALGEQQAVSLRLQSERPETVVERSEVPVLTDPDRALIHDLMKQMQDSVDVLGQRLLDTLPHRAVALPPQPRTQAPSRPRPIVTPETVPSDVRFRAGAQRMIETLGRMYPLHLTKAQWGTVSSMKTTSGTWSTYFGELKRAGFIDSDAAGFFLTDAGFDYLGGRPAPMTADELQQHYRTILRAGAVRMLDAIMAAYPDALGKDAIGEQVDMVTSSGTFSTYLGELVRNGLVEKDAGEFRATDILMRGAAA